jgi:glycosyltransferase involved in cell wall biosynthesis
MFEKSCHAGVPVTAFIITCNEDRRLRECISKLSFCSQIVVVDLGSTDNTLSIVNAFNVELHHATHQPIAEIVRKEYLSICRHDWILYVDPDECCPDALADVVAPYLSQDDVGIIKLPWEFYFKDKPLHGTVWGGKNYKVFLINKNRVLLNDHVHRGFSLLPNNREILIPWEQPYVVKHFWMDTYKGLFSKHLRYIRSEGRSRFLNGERFDLQLLARETYLAFVRHTNKAVLKDGFVGIFLLFFYPAYIFFSILSLGLYQLQNSR